MSASPGTVVISEFMDEGAVSLLRSRFDVIYDPSLVENPASLGTKLATANALIVRNRTQVDRTLLAAGPGLSVVGRLGVGLDNIDLKACQDNDIAVIPATGANSAAVAEYVIATAIMLLRGCFFASTDVAEGAWPRAQLSSGREAAGKTLGLVGFGGIGRLVARLAQGLGMVLVAHDANLSPDDLVWGQSGVVPLTFDELVAQSDVISLHLPLTKTTRGLFGADVMSRMKPGSVLINTSRGGIVDQGAVVDALRHGHLAGAALDVFDDEPLQRTPAFLAVPGLVLTPHIAGVTHESNERVSYMIAQSIIDYLSNSRQQNGVGAVHG